MCVSVFVSVFVVSLSSLGVSPAIELASRLWTLIFVQYINVSLSMFLSCGVKLKIYH